jgi:hypothetical protein
MPCAIVDAGTQACTLATDHNLGSGLTGPAGGAHYALILDCNALQAGETLYAYALREIAAAGTQRRLYDVAVATGGGSHPIVDGIILRLPENIDGTFGIRQEGGTGRSILWSIEIVDGN